MKKIDIVTAIAGLGLIIAGSTLVRADAPFPVPTPPTGSVIRDLAEAKPKTFNVICPGRIQSGPLNVPSGWQSLQGPFRLVSEITISQTDRTILCGYGLNGDNFFATPYIAQKIPTGYECKRKDPFSFEAVCTEVKQVHR